MTSQETRQQWTYQAAIILVYWYNRNENDKALLTIKSVEDQLAGRQFRYVN